jgi:hypothetical protein
MSQEIQTRMMKKINHSISIAAIALLLGGMLIMTSSEVVVQQQATSPLTSFSVNQTSSWSQDTKLF